MSFDFIAPHYRRLESVAFADKLQTARVAFVDHIGKPKRALIAGEGNGRFLRVLLDKHRAIEVDCVDASAQMLELARKHPRDERRVRFIHADLSVRLPEEDAYDLIVTHFFLDCFAEDEIALIVDKLARAATRDAVWLLADFSIPPHGLAKIHARLWLYAMYQFFRLTAGITGRELIDPSEFLRAHHFRLEGQNFQRFGLIKSELWRRL